MLLLPEDVCLVTDISGNRSAPFQGRGRRDEQRERESCAPERATARRLAGWVGGATSRRAAWRALRQTGQVDEHEQQVKWWTVRPSYHCATSRRRARLVGSPCSSTSGRAARGAASSERELSTRECYSTAFSRVGGRRDEQTSSMVRAATNRSSR